MYYRTSRGQRCTGSSRQDDTAVARSIVPSVQPDFRSLSSVDSARCFFSDLFDSFEVYYYY